MGGSFHQFIQVNKQNLIGIKTEQLAKLFTNVTGQNKLYNR